MKQVLSTYIFHPHTTKQNPSPWLYEKRLIPVEINCWTPGKGVYWYHFSYVFGSTHTMVQDFDLPHSAAIIIEIKCLKERVLVPSPPPPI